MWMIRHFQVLPVFCCVQLRHCTSRTLWIYLVGNRCEQDQWVLLSLCHIKTIILVLLLNFPNSSLTLWRCTSSEKDGQNCKNTGELVFRQSTWVHCLVYFSSSSRFWVICDKSLFWIFMEVCQTSWIGLEKVRISLNNNKFFLQWNLLTSNLLSKT